jgi:hypothetical protein
LPENILEELHQYDNMSDKEIMTQQAASLKSINDMLSGLVESIEALLGEKLVDYIPKIQEYIEKNGGKLIDDVETFVTEKIPEYWQTLKGWWNSLKGFWTGLKEDWKETKAILRDISRALLLGGFMAYGAKGMSALKGKFGKSPKGANGAPSGGGAPGGGGAKPSSGKPFDPHVVKKGNHTYTQDSQGNWVNENGTKVKKHKDIAKLNKAHNDQIKLAAKNTTPSSQANASAANSATNNTLASSAKSAAKAPKPSMWSKLTKFTPKLIKGANIAGWAGLAGDIASDSMANSGWIEKGGGAHKTTKALSNAASYGALGATIGGFTGPAAPIAAPLLAAVGAIYGGITGWNEAAEMEAESAEEAKQKAKEAAKGKGGYAAGGIIGTKDNVIGLATGEIVMSKTMQENTNVLKSMDLRLSELEKKNEV